MTRHISPYGFNACWLLCFFSAQFHLDLSYDGSSCMLALHASVSQKSILLLILSKDYLLGLICPRFSLKTDYLHSGHMHLRYPPKTRLDGEQSSVKLHLTGKVRLTLRLYGNLLKIENKKLRHAPKKLFLKGDQLIFRG